MSSEKADFEDSIIEYVDVMNLAMQIKNANKRSYLIYKAMGYEDWSIALELGVSERTLRRYISSLRRDLKRFQRNLS
jgi:DNA-binding NarL/FixJ family response regulator